MEDRVLLSAATVNATQTLRAADPQLLGINTATWDGLLSSSTTLQLAQAAGLTSVRLPGGSSSDVYHFSANPDYNQSLGQMAEFGAALDATMVATVNYGSGSPQEGVAMWSYLNGSPTDTTVIGSGPEFNTTTNTWSSVNWHTVGYWASLREASPLKTDDGLNFLRLGAGSSVDHPAAFNVQNWEIGNEEYGSWETDGHGVSGSGLTLPNNATPAIHDPETYVAFAKVFATQVRAIIAEEKAPAISIGVDSPGPDTEYSSWIANLLLQGKAQGFIPDFISDHVYDQGPGYENDANLLSYPNTPETVATGSDSLDWAQRAAEYQSLISTNLGSAGANIQLLATEVNSVYGDPGKQITSLVNGLFIADSLGSLMETSYNGAWVWDLHNGTPGTENNSSTLYGWHEYGDYGIIGNGDGGVANQPTPNYFAEQLLSKIVQTGGEVVSVTGGSSLLDTFSVLEPNGDLELLVINKNPPAAGPPNNLPDQSVTQQFSLQNFIASGAATVWQYGVAQDDAQDTTGASSLSEQTSSVTVAGGAFSYAFPNYSMTVLDLSPDKGPTVASSAAGPIPSVTGTTAALSVLGAENGSDTGLTYTWSATGPAAVSYTGSFANGTNGAKNITAVFTAPGVYKFTATITDSQGLTATSATTVTVVQTAAVISITPETSVVVTGGTEQFSASATDQFTAVIPSPVFTWAVTGTGNTITSAGLLTLGSVAGPYSVSATIGNVSGSATVTAAVAPQATSVQVNGNTAGLVGTQRSMVNSIVYTFNQPVNVAANAFTIAVHTGQSGTVPTLSWAALSPAADGSSASWAVTFSGNGVTGSSIGNGVYDLSMTAGAITSDLYPTITALTRPTDTFWRLYGDFAGNGYVGNADYTAFLGTYGLKSTQAGYLAAFDATGTNARIGNADYLDFLDDYGIRYRNVTLLATI